MKVALLIALVRGKAIVVATHHGLLAAGAVVGWVYIFFPPVSRSRALRNACGYFTVLLWVVFLLAGLTSAFWDAF